MDEEEEFNEDTLVLGDEDNELEEEGEEDILGMGFHEEGGEEPETDF